MKRIYTVEIDTGEDVIPEMGGEDVDYILCHHLGKALTDAGYARGLLTSKTSRSKYTFDTDGNNDKVTP